MMSLNVLEGMMTMMMMMMMMMTTMMSMSSSSATSTLGSTAIATMKVIIVIMSTVPSKSVQQPLLHQIGHKNLHGHLTATAIETALCLLDEAYAWVKA